MWIDERGSEVLPLAECRRLLAVAAKQGVHGHLGVSDDGAPIVLPVNFSMSGHDVILRIGEGLFTQVAERGLVAFQVDGVDGVDGDQPWSVLVRGAAIEVSDTVDESYGPAPIVAVPGHHIVKVRGDIVTGRRMNAAQTGSAD